MDLQGTWAYGPQKKHPLVSKRRKAVAWLVFGLMVMGAAFAAWLVTSSGNGYQKAATLAPFTFNNVSGTITGEMVPGGDYDLILNLDNPNAVPLRITAVRRVAAGVTTNNGSCPGSVLSFPKSGDAVSILVAAGATGEEVRIPAFVRFDAGAPNACQGTVFTIPIEADATT